MKIERLNENQLRFTVWSKDLPDEDFTIADLAGQTEKAEELIKYMMNKAREEFGFVVNEQPIVVEAIPVNKDCIVFLITKVENEEEEGQFSYIEKLKKQAMDMAIMTKGYPFAYQALGKYLWEDEKHEMNVAVLARFDEALSHYAYRKIWSELSPKDRWYMSFIVKKDNMSTAELLQMTGQKKNEFSQYRARLKDKGLINVSNRGVIKYTLPRFDVFVENENVM